jgi:hypothetical protein
MTTSIPIKDAEEISKRRGCPVVIIFGIDAIGDRFTVTTYGRSRKLCRHAADLGKKFSASVLNGTVTPAPAEPMQLPNAPTRWDGIREK